MGAAASFKDSQSDAESVAAEPIAESVADVEEAPNDSWFSTWRVAKGAPLKALVQEVVEDVWFYEDITARRRRALKEKDRRFRAAAVEMIVSNLAWHIYSPVSKGYIAYGRSKMNAKSRYRHPGFSADSFVQAVDWLEEQEFLRSETGYQGRSSTMTATEILKARLDQHGVTLADVGRDPSEEVIYLTRKIKDFKQASIGRDFVEYLDTPDTHRMRTELRELNTALEAADVAFVDDGEEPVDVTVRRLTRQFSLFEGQEPRFDQHGRLYGAFWINMKSYRRAHIRVHGEPCVDLDFTGMFISLAYAKVGKALPLGQDPYDLTGHLKGYEGAYRDGVKALFNAALFGFANTKLPKNVKAYSIEADEEARKSGLDVKWLPPGTTLRVARAAFDLKHPDICDLWSRKEGYGFLFTESEILVSILRKLREAGVTGLPCHDGLLVPESCQEIAVELMEDTSREICGAALSVKHKPFRQKVTLTSI